MLVPTLQSVCGARFPAPQTYGQPLPGGRVQRREVIVSERGTRGRVVGRTTPPVPTLAQLARGRSSELCASGYLVEVDGRTFAANARRVRELNRTPREPCPVHISADAATVAALVAEAEALVAAGEVAHVRDVLHDLPWPHHRAGGPCCASSRHTPEGVLQAFEPWAKGAAARRQVDAARAAIPPALRATVKVTRLDDVPAAMRRVQDYCFDQVKRWVETARTPRREKFAATKRAARSGYDFRGSRILGVRI